MNEDDELVEEDLPTKEEIRNKFIGETLTEEREEKMINLGICNVKVSHETKEIKEIEFLPSWRPSIDIDVFEEEFK